MIKSHFKIADGFNVLPLQQAIKRQPWLFGQHIERCTGESPHRETTDIWVRFNKDIPPFGGKPWQFSNDEHDSQWYPSYYMLPQVRPLVFDLMHLVDGERLGAVFITKTPPGCKIHPHTDNRWHAEYYDKYYIPIQNNEGATFEFPDGVIKPNLGEVWWFDNSVDHWVNNSSTEDRLSLIVCIRSDSTKNTVRSNINNG